MDKFLEFLNKEIEKTESDLEIAQLNDNPGEYLMSYSLDILNDIKSKYEDFIKEKGKE